MRFLRLVRENALEIVVSAVVEKEIYDPDTPAEVIGEYERHGRHYTVADITEEALELQSACIKQKILTRRWEDDALHVAVATTNGCDMIVSWNFRHIVNFRKIPLYNAVNTLFGYRGIRIYSPLEVIEDEDSQGF